MVETSTVRLWSMRLVFLALGGVALFFDLLPLSTAPGGWPAPDVLLALCLAWSLRRPDFAPAMSIAGLMLLADLLYQRPPGLFAAMVLFACSKMWTRSSTTKDAGFGAEMLTVAVTVMLLLVAYRVVLGAMLVPRPSLGLSLAQGVLTIAVYPVVVGFSQFVLGVRARTPAEMAAGRVRV